MNIIIDIRCLIEPDYSGVQAYAYNLLQNLFKIDQKNQYYLFYNKSEKHSEIIKKVKQIRALLNYPNVKLADFHYPNKFLNFSLRFLKYPKLDKLVEKKIGTKIDIWFSPNLGFINFSNANTRHGAFLLTIHDLSFERYPEFFASRKNFGIKYIRGRFWHKYVGAKKICEQADKIIAVSESAKNDLMDIYKISKDKIQVIYEGFGRPIECPSSCQEVKNRYNLPEKFILFLGTIEPRKNIANIIRAFEKLSQSIGVEHPIGCSTPVVASQDYHLIIAGKKGWLYDDLFKLAKESKVKNKIKFIGYVSEEDKFALYKLAELFVFPSFYEGFGLPPLEAMACGTAVIASATFSLSEVVGDAGLLIDPYDVNELAKAIKIILNDSELRARMVGKGLKRSQIFSWENAAKESLVLFEKFNKK